MGTGPDLIFAMLKKSNFTTQRICPPPGEAVSFGSFSLRLSKENEPGCRAGTRRS
jgi:hypothetical protein